ncbi:MAG: hypothetical protein HGA38_03950 [Candidatus Moranbacteria bacterium]|nr:hypothetical protein [Candidatus Moranbacteria bacterium]NTW46030.1 hypothetical protein [Candidatus Moranbacteria bacterium]
MNRMKNLVGGLRADFLLLACLVAIGYGIFVTSAEEMRAANIVDDSDQDGLTGAEERLYGTDPANRDTDSDGYSDGVEIRGGYDPLKAAPGDKIVQETKAEKRDETSSGGMGGDNLTDTVSEKLAALVKASESNVTSDGTTEVSIEDLTSIAQEISGGAEEVSLPDVDLSAIKVKDETYAGLSESKRKERIKEDITEYLTTVSFIFASNSPVQITNQSELQSVSESFANEAITAVSMGNVSSLDTYVESGQRMLEQINEVEVPQQMLDTHVKALKLATYMAKLKDDVGDSIQDDPVMTIKTLSKVQGLLGVVGVFVTDVQSKLSDYGITSIPLELQ